MYLTHKSFLSRVANSGSKYWSEGKNYRWQYMSYVIDCLKIMGAWDICEAGTSGIPLNNLSHQIESDEKNIVNPVGIIHDLNIFPYPVKHISKFDAFVALQVWEHLDNQAQAFREVMRISRAAILSFPYRWTGGDKRHKGIDEKKINGWTCGIKPISIKIINHRAIYVWRFK